MEPGGAVRVPDAGGYEIWLLHVGELDAPAGDVLPDEPVQMPVTATLLRGHGRTALIDAGSGPADVLWRGAARLDEALAVAGSGAAAIDVCLLTHLDFDHAGGALSGTWPDRLGSAFPRAIVSAVEIDYWHARPLDAWNTGSRLLAAYGERVTLAADGDEVLPGVRLLSAPGHRPGHCVVAIGDELLHGADLIHHEAHIANPAWDHANDHDVPVALATRTAWIERLRTTGMPALFSHLLGRVRIAPDGSLESA